MGGVAVGPQRAGTTRAAAGSVAQRDHHASACAPQFRLQASQELLSRLGRAAAARLLSRHAVLRTLRHPAEKCLRAAGGLPRQPPRDQDRALLHRLHRPCDNHRLSRHKVFADLAQRGKTSMGWFFGFKLHLVFNNDNEIVALKLTPGNVHDTKPVPALTRDLIGKLFGDKGYIGRKLAEDLLRRGLTLFTRVRRNMKSLPMSLHDKALLNARNMADIGQIKEFSSLNLSKHRSVINAFVHIIAAITAYQINPFKPKRNLQPRYRLQTTA